MPRRIARIARLLLAVTLALVSLGAGGGAAPTATGKARAREHFGRALELIDQNKHGEAAIEFRRAYQASPHYSVLYDLGQAYVASGQRLEAYRALRRYLEEGGARVPPARRRSVSDEIERQRAHLGELVMELAPPQAELRLDGKAVAHSPGAPILLVEGSHGLSASLRGFETQSRTITVRGASRSTVRLELVALPGPRQVTAELVVACPVPGVGVAIDGDRVGTTPLPGPLRLPAGPHQITFARPGYRRAARRIAASADQRVQVDCGARPLSPLPPALAGQLEVEVSEPDARVLLDGAPLGQDGTVVAGPHRLEVRRAGFEPWHLDVRVDAAGAKHLEALLVPTAEYAAERHSAAARQRIWAYALGGSGLALGVATVAVAVYNDGRYGDWQDERATIEQGYAILPPYPPELTQRSVDNDELLQSIQTVDELAVGLGVAGGALLAAGVVVFLVGDDPDHYPELRAQARAGGLTAGWAGRW